MFSFLKYAYNQFSDTSGQQSKEEVLDELLSKLEEDDEVDEVEKVEQINYDDEDTEYVRKSGRITMFEGTHGVIDSNIIIDRTVVSNCRFSNELAEDVQVEYTAKKREDGSLHIIKLERLKETKTWNDELDNDIAEDIQAVGVEYQLFIARSILGEVQGRRMSLITVSHDNGDPITIDMDQTEVDFVPMVGDYCVLNCKVLHDENFLDCAGETIHVLKMSYGRKCSDYGTVTAVNEEWGEVDNNIIFYFDALENGCRPSRGDKVEYEAIECKQKKFIKRCIQVRITEVKNKWGAISNKENVASTFDADFFKDKYGIVITDDIKFEFSDLDQVERKTIEIKNNATNRQKLLKFFFMAKKQMSQLELITPASHESFFLQPGESLTYILQAKSKNYGKSEEVIAFSFGGPFKIARKVIIAVKEPEGYVGNGNNPTLNMVKYNKRSTTAAYNVMLQNRNEEANDTVPGQPTKKSPHFIDIRFDKYNIPPKLHECMVAPSPSSQEREENLLELYPCLQTNLSPQTYKPVYRCFLHLEEIQRYINIRTYDMGRAHFTRENSFLALRIENVSDRRPSLIIGDSVKATNPWSNDNKEKEIVYQGFIHKILSNRILLKFNETFHDSYRGEDYKLVFYYTRGDFQKNHHALTKIIENMGMDFLFPTKITLQAPKLNLEINRLGNLHSKDFGDNEYKWFNPSLNPIQKIAVKNVLRGEARPNPYIIYGPPGTGKTMTLIETILQIAHRFPDSRIMVGTPSNSAANLITTRLISTGHLNPGELIRLVSQNLVEKELIPEELAPYCATVDIGSERASKDEFIETESGLRLRLRLSALGRHKISIGTCVTLGQLMHIKFPHNHFTHILIDEAGQCLETETLIPMNFISKSCGQIILAGDPKQLGPVVLSNMASTKGFGESMMVRLLRMQPYQKDTVRFEDDYDPRLVTKLRYNYRSIPSILNLYSDLFYEGQLIPKVSATSSEEFEFLAKIKDILPGGPDRNPSNGFFFIGVNGTNIQSPDSPSWFNPAEAKTVFSFLLKLYRNKVSAEDIGIISPYQQQVKFLRKLVEEANLVVPKIGSVEEFQGQERKVIIISTVRSSVNMVKRDIDHSLGFVSSEKRLNVAISRARALLVLIGNPDLLASDMNWRKLLLAAVKGDTYSGSTLPEQL